MSASRTDALASKVRSLLSDAEALEALSRTRPHVFAEQKDGLVRGLADLLADVGDSRTGDRRPVRTSTFRPGVIVQHGRLIQVQRRGGRLPRR